MILSASGAQLSCLTFWKVTSCCQKSMSCSYTYACNCLVSVQAQFEASPEVARELQKDVYAAPRTWCEACGHAAHSSRDTGRSSKLLLTELLGISQSTASQLDARMLSDLAAGLEPNCPERVAHPSANAKVACMQVIAAMYCTTDVPLTSQSPFCQWLAIGSHMRSGYAAAGSLRQTGRGDYVCRQSSSV